MRLYYAIKMEYVQKIVSSDWNLSMSRCNYYLKKKEKFCTYDAILWVILFLILNLQ